MDKDFFDERLLYYGLNDFYKRRLIIKTLFKCKTLKEQYLYRLYVYSRAFINDTWKDRMWEYIQNDITDEQFVEFYTLYMERKNINQ